MLDISYLPFQTRDIKYVRSAHTTVAVGIKGPEHPHGVVTVVSVYASPTASKPAIKTEL